MSTNSYGSILSAPEGRSYPKFSNVKVTYISGNVVVSRRRFLSRAINLAFRARVKSPMISFISFFRSGANFHSDLSPFYRLCPNPEVCKLRICSARKSISRGTAHWNVTILEGGEFVQGFCTECGGINRGGSPRVPKAPRGHPKGAEGPEGCPLLGMICLYGKVMTNITRSPMRTAMRILRDDSSCRHT